LTEPTVQNFNQYANPQTSGEKNIYDHHCCSIAHVLHLSYLSGVNMEQEENESDIGNN
jgi:hypothetical protein